MSNEEINELFYGLQKECASRAAQIAPTWEDIVARQTQTSSSQQAYNFEGGIISTTIQVTSLNPKTLCHVTTIRVRGHMTIAPMDIQLCKVKEVKVPIIKSNYGNHMIKSYSLH